MISENPMNLLPENVQRLNSRKFVITAILAAFVLMAAISSSRSRPHPKSVLAMIRWIQPSRLKLNEPDRASPRIACDSRSARCSAFRIGEHHAINVLQSIHLLQQNLRAIGSPFHLRRVVFTSISRHVQPNHVAAIDTQYSQTRCRIFVADFGIRKRLGTIRLKAFPKFCLLPCW